MLNTKIKNMINEKEIKKILFNEYRQLLQYKNTEINGYTDTNTLMSMQRHCGAVEMCLVILCILTPGEPFQYKTIDWKTTFWTNKRVEIKETYVDLLIRLTEECLRNEIKK